MLARKKIVPIPSSESVVEIIRSSTVISQMSNVAPITPTIPQEMQRMQIGHCNVNVYFQFILSIKNFVFHMRLISVKFIIVKFLIVEFIIVDYNYSFTYLYVCMEVDPLPSVP